MQDVGRQCSTTIRHNSMAMATACRVGQDDGYKGVAAIDMYRNTPKAGVSITDLRNDSAKLEFPSMPYSQPNYMVLTWS